MDAARAESVIRAVEGWRAAVASGAAAWDAAARALAALQDGGEEQEVPAVAGGDRHRDAVMRVYEELMQEAPSAGLHAFVERERRRGQQAAGSRARRRRPGAEGDDAGPTRMTAAVATAALCAFPLATSRSADGRSAGGASAAEALQSSLARLRASLGDAEDASAVLGAEARALEGRALADEDEDGPKGGDEGEGAAAAASSAAPVAALEAALLASGAAAALSRELRWMRRAALGAGPETPAASAEAAAATWRLQPFTDDDTLDALAGGCSTFLDGA